MTPTRCTRSTPCGRVERGKPFAAGRHCPRCWRFAHTRDFNLAQGGTGDVANVLAPPGPVWLLPGLRDPLPAGSQCDRLHREALARVADEAPPEPFTGGRGRGVLTVGGGKFWPGIVVMARMLRDTGSTLPVEVWHRGSCEPVDPADVEGMGVTFVDAEKVAAERGDARMLTGWGQKLYALTHTRLDTVLFLDADAYPVADPSPLLDLAERNGFVCWNDMPDQDAFPKWNAVLPGGDRFGLPSIQGGQLAVRRDAVWPQLCAAHWVCQHADHYWPADRPRAEWLLYGDQDAWRAAFAATGFRPHSLGRARWDSVAFVCETGGVPYVVHRCQGKMLRPRDLTGDRENKPHWHLPGEARAFEHLAHALRGEDGAAAFGHVYRAGHWSGGSGAGSSAAEALPYTTLVNGLAAALGWASVVDVGCGDGRVAAGLAVAGYRGFDVAPAALALFAANAPGKAAELLDAVAAPERLPAADAILVKDVFHHLPNDLITSFLTRVRGLGRWRHLVAAYDRPPAGAAVAADCHAGGYRPLTAAHPALAPFGPVPLADYLHKSAALFRLGAA
jgi:hypothetical protein